MSSETLEILGIEKSLLKFKGKKAKNPKNGLLYRSFIINETKTFHKKRITKFLANKCLLSSRLDYFYKKVI